jgi:glycosyltransferase involved in cell wall biosynthesis
MKVLYDYQIFALQKYGGISRYFVELMNVYYQNKNIDFELPLIFSNNIHIMSSPFSNHKKFFPNLRLGLKNKYTKYLNKKNLIFSSKIISQQNYDIIHPTYYNPYFLNHIGDKPYVITIHDMTYEIYPEYFRKNNDTSELKKMLSKNASKIITVSENTKNDVLKFYNIDESKIIVVHHGNSIFVNKELESNKLNLELPNKFILYVGNRGSYKNFNTFFKAISQIAKKYDDLNVICAGGGRFSKKEMEFIKECEMEKRTEHYMLNDQLLKYLYSKAVAFIYPSLYEGFGMPILEAFDCKCPVLLSNVSSFPEVAGDAALYFDPLSISSIVTCIEQILADNTLRENLIIAGLKKSKEYSWENTAEKTKLVYESIF